MSIASEISRIKGNVSASYTVCRELGATMPTVADQDSDHLADTINTITGGGPAPAPAVEKDVNFYDFDGTLLYSYTLQEAAALSALPALPTHTNLVSPEWNYTLEDMQEALTSGYPALDIGATYQTKDDKTRLYLQGVKSSELNGWGLRLRFARGTVTVTINGVDVATETNSSNSGNSYTLNFNLPPAPTYPADYVVEVAFTYVNSYSKFFLGRTDNSFHSIFGDDYEKLSKLVRIDVDKYANISSCAFQSALSLETVVLSRHITGDSEYTISSQGFWCCPRLKAVIFNKNVKFALQAFNYCTALKTVVFAPYMTFGSLSFQYCTSIKRVIFPRNLIASSLSQVFIFCSSLNILVFPTDKTTTYVQMFTNCANIYRVIIPSNITTIGNSVFTNCYGLKLLDLTSYRDPNNIPTLQNTGALQGTPSDGAILVYNQAMLDAFTAATNWSSYASRFQKQN